MGTSKCSRLNSSAESFRVIGLALPQAFNPYVSTDKAFICSLLLRSDHPDVRVLTDTARKVPARHARAMVLRGQYEVGGSLKRIRWIRPVAIGSQWIECYRTTMATSIQPGFDSVSW